MKKSNNKPPKIDDLGISIFLATLLVLPFYIITPLWLIWLITGETDEVWPLILFVLFGILASFSFYSSTIESHKKKVKDYWHNEYRQLAGIDDYDDFERERCKEIDRSESWTRDDDGLFYKKYITEIQKNVDNGKTNNKGETIKHLSKRTKLIIGAVAGVAILAVVLSIIAISKPAVNVSLNGDEELDAMPEVIQSAKDTLYEGCTNAGGTHTKCTCFANYLLDNYKVSELSDISDRPDYERILDRALDKCSSVR